MQIQWWNILKNRLTWKLNSNIFLRRIVDFENLQEEFTIEGVKEILNRDDRKRGK